MTQPITTLDFIQIRKNRCFQLMEQYDLKIKYSELCYDVIQLECAVQTEILAKILDNQIKKAGYPYATTFWPGIGRT